MCMCTQTHTHRAVSFWNGYVPTVLSGPNHRVIWPGLGWFSITVLVSLLVVFLPWPFRPRCSPFLHISKILVGLWASEPVFLGSSVKSPLHSLLPSSGSLPLLNADSFCVIYMVLKHTLPWDTTSLELSLTACSVRIFSWDEIWLFQWGSKRKMYPAPATVFWELLGLDRRKIWAQSHSPHHFVFSWVPGAQ